MVYPDVKAGRESLVYSVFLVDQESKDRKVLLVCSIRIWLNQAVQVLLEHKDRWGLLDRLDYPASMVRRDLVDPLDRQENLVHPDLQVFKACLA